MKILHIVWCYGSALKEILHALCYTRCDVKKCNVLQRCKRLPQNACGKFSNSDCVLKKPILWFWFFNFITRTAGYFHIKEIKYLNNDHSLKGGSPHFNIFKGEWKGKKRKKKSSLKHEKEATTQKNCSRIRGSNWVPAIFLRFLTCVFGKVRWNWFAKCIAIVSQSALQLFLHAKCFGIFCFAKCVAIVICRVCWNRNCFAKCVGIFVFSCVCVCVWVGWCVRAREMESRKKDAAATAGVSSHHHRSHGGGAAHHHGSSRTHRRKDPPPNSRQILGLMFLLSAVGFVLLLAGVTLTGTTITVLLATPVVIFFSPVWIPLATVAFFAVSALLGAGAFGVAAVSAVSWVYNYFRGRHPDGSDRVSSYVKPQISRKFIKVFSDFTLYYSCGLFSALLEGKSCGVVSVQFGRKTN